jgi:hypothetical protein
MKYSVYTDPQFLDAAGVGGLNSGVTTTTDAITSLGNAVWAGPGLVTPEAMTIAFSGTTATVGLPRPWGIISSGGVVVHAHGTQTGADTSSYSVNFASLVPASGAVTAYLAATITQIQQDPFPIVGPPPGHPSFNTNSVPPVAYATNVFSVALTAVSGVPDNINTFELARTTLVPSTTAISVAPLIGQKRATEYKTLPVQLLTTGGVLTQAQAQVALMPTVGGLTHTLPVAANSGGLTYTFINTTTGNWTVATSGLDVIQGLFSGVAGVSSVVLPPQGVMTVWCNASTGGQWDLLSINANAFTSQPNKFVVNQTFTDPGTGGITITGSSATGGGIKLIGQGVATPSKTLRVVNGVFQVVNDAGSSVLLSIADNGAMQVAGLLTGLNGLSITGNATIQAGLSAASVTGATANLGGVIFPGGSDMSADAITANSAVIGGTTITSAVLSTGGNIQGGNITSTGQIVGLNVQASNGNVTANNGRLRAAFGATNSGDPNAAAILSDFFHIFPTTSDAYILQSLPSGFFIQSQNGVTTGGITTLTFPNAFLTECAQVLVTEANPSGWNSTQQNPTIFAAASLSRTQCSIYISRWSGSLWVGVTGIAFRWIAIGN